MYYLGKKRRPHFTNPVLLPRIVLAFYPHFTPINGECPTFTVLYEHFSEECDLAEGKGSARRAAEQTGQILPDPVW